MNKVKVLVPISGGKDSQAALKLALQVHTPDEIRGLFCDTKFEHPLTYAHVEWMREHYGVRIDIVSGGSVLEKSIKYGRFPGGGARHCTDELKIRETRMYCKDLAEQQGAGFEVWYGMRSAESSARAKRYAGKVCDVVYAPHEVMPSKYPKYLAKMGVSFRLCILNWSDIDVLEFLAGEENPLYALGFPRVGCFPCLASGDKWKAKAFEHDDFGREQYIRVVEVGRHINKSCWTSKAGKAKYDVSPGCMVCSI